MSEPEETTIGDRIKFIRGSIPQNEFANALGICRNTLWYWESNKGFPDFERCEFYIVKEHPSGRIVTREKV